MMRSMLFMPRFTLRLDTSSSCIAEARNLAPPNSKRKSLSILFFLAVETREVTQ